MDKFGLDISAIIEKQLVDELSKSIDKSIIDTLMKMGMKQENRKSKIESIIDKIDQSKIESNI